MTTAWTRSGRPAALIGRCPSRRREIASAERMPAEVTCEADSPRAAARRPLARSSTACRRDPPRARRSRSRPPPAGHAGHQRADHQRKGRRGSISRPAASASDARPAARPVQTGADEPVDSVAYESRRARPRCGGAAASGPFTSSSAVRRRYPPDGGRCPNRRMTGLTARSGSRSSADPTLGTAQRSAIIRLRFLRPARMRQRWTLSQTNKELQQHGQDHRHRPRHDELVHGRARGRRADGDRQRRGRPHDPVGRRLHRRRRAPRRHRRQAPGGHQPREHHLLHQALHGPQGGRGARGGVDRALQGRRRPQRRRPRRGAAASSTARRRSRR